MRIGNFSVPDPFAPVSNRPPVPSPAPREPSRSPATAAMFLACAPWVGAGGAHAAERVTIPGNSGTITLEWEATQDRKGRPIIVGGMITYGGMSGYCIPLLLVETLDPQGQATAQRMDFIPGFVGGFDNVCFDELIRAPGPADRVSIASWDKCAGGGQ